MNQDEMNQNEMIIQTKKALKSHGKLDNPWMEGLVENHISYNDHIFISSRGYNEIRNKIFWDNDNSDIFKHQFPIPINGNFYKAKYLLLYSNPATEIKDIKTKDKLVKCFRLDDNAKLTIDDWEDWYIGELDKFFVHRKNNAEDLYIDTFFDNFCFINLFAYQTQNNSFDFKSKELKQLHELPSTIFAKKLVEIGIEAGKEVLVIRRSEGVWKHKSDKSFMFDKLGSYYQSFKSKREEN